LHFNYRVVRAEYKGEPYFEIRTVHYNNAGEICLISKEATVPIGETAEELHKVFQQYLMAFEKPILEEKEIKFGKLDGEDGPWYDLDFDDPFPESSESSETPESSGSSMHMRWLLQQTDM
jgi:hypothetical protein